MRFRGLLLTTGQSLAVMVEVDAWCRRTGTNYNRLIVAAGVAPSLRSDVRCRGRKLTKMTAQKLRRTMRQFASGISRQQHKEHLGEERRELAQQIEKQVRQIAAVMTIDRTPCPRCGVRADIGCEHTRRFERQPLVGIMRV